MCPMLRGSILLALSFFSGAFLFFRPGLQAQQECGVEVKILLSSTDSQAAAALGAKKQSAGRIYFFDTNEVDLLSQGLIVRLRQGSRGDLTVKLRPPGGKQSSAHVEGSECEVDLTGEGENYSYSISSPFDEEKLPESGFEILRLLDSGQTKMLQSAHVPLDWSRVKRVADIASTSWQIRDQPPFGKLTLELWAWPGGSLLELSTKVRPDAASTTYLALRQLVKKKHLSISPDQGLKTMLALKAITHSTPRE
jgi:hypothetical protein